MELNPSLVLASGPLAGTRYPLREEVTRIGRNPGNDIVIRGSDAAVVSGNHLEIRRDGERFVLRDLGSTNGTFLDGQRTEEAELKAPCVIRLGPGGPELDFVLDGDEEPEPVDLNQTLAAPPPGAAPADGAEEKGLATEHERLLRSAVVRARSARGAGMANQTVTIMREVLDQALRRTSRKFKRALAVLLAALVIGAAYASWQIYQLARAKAAIDVQIHALEAKLAHAGPASTEQLIAALQQYQDQGLALQSSLLFRLSLRQHEDFVTHEIRVLLAEFGAEVYSVPSEFVAQVKRFIAQYQGPDRPLMERALGQARPALDRMRRIFEEQHLPPDLAYIAVVESAMGQAVAENRTGAAGLWQFTPATAKAYGLRVGAGDDERLDVEKATRAACKYMRELILDFGAGTSVMLALAAYNVGPTRVKQAIRKKVNDPIKQRSFWYLYRVGALPEETREYVPKVMAVMIIGRAPERFEF